MKISLIARIVLVIIVVLGSFYLRYRDFDKIPFAGESMDEYSYSWVGMSILKIGVPVGISGIGGYANSISRYENIDNVFQSTAGGNPETLNWPWFDHPPLLGLITGGYAMMKGAGNFKETNIYIIRKPMVVLGTISVLLVLLIGWVNFGFLTGLASGVIYGTMPIVVIGSRMVQGENGVIPAYLTAVLFISLFYKTKRNVWLILAGVFSGLAVLFKISGLVAILAIGICLLKDQKKFLWKFLVISLSVASLFIIYGLSIDPRQFMTTFLSNSSRFYGIGPESLFRLITQVKITNVKYFTDPMVLVGWLALFGLFFRKANKLGDRLLRIFGASWAVMYVVLGSYPHGWYAFPFFPILAIALGRVWMLAMDNSEYFSGALMLGLISIGYFFSRIVDIMSFQKLASYWKFGIGGLLTYSIIFQKRKYILVFLLLIIISFELIYLHSITVDFWYKVF